MSFELKWYGLGNRGFSGIKNLWSMCSNGNKSWEPVKVTWVTWVILGAMLIMGTPQAQSRMYLHSENPSPGLTGGLDWIESVSTADFPCFLYHISPNDPALSGNNSSTTFRRSKGSLSPNKYRVIPLHYKLNVSLLVSWNFLSNCDPGVYWLYSHLYLPPFFL